MLCHRFWSSTHHATLSSCLEWACSQPQTENVIRMAVTILWSCDWCQASWVDQLTALFNTGWQCLCSDRFVVCYWHPRRFWPRITVRSMVEPARVRLGPVWNSRNKEGLVFSRGNLTSLSELALDLLSGERSNPTESSNFLWPKRWNSALN